MTKTFNIFKLIIGLSIISIFITVISCDKNPCDPDDGKEVGTLFITVSGSYGEIIEGAVVTTEPSKESGLTDELGTYTINNVPTGIYSIAATKLDYGSGKEAATVESNKVTNVDIKLVRGVFFSYAPTVEILTPTIKDVFSSGEQVEFSAKVSDRKTKNVDLKITWSSDIDGILDTSSADTNGIASFNTTSLSLAEHIVKISVTDEDDYTTNDSIKVITLYPNLVQLNEPKKQSGHVILDWNHTNDQLFSKYEIYRSNDSSNVNQGDLITTVTDPSTKSSIDSLPPFANEVFYQVFVTNTQGYTRGSNIVSVSDPAGLVLDFVPYDAVIHPNQPKLYLLNRDESKVTVVDYLEMKIVVEKNFSGYLGYMDIGDNGEGIELYIPNSDGWVYIYDAEELNQVSSIKTGLGNACVVIDGNGYLYVSVDPSPWWEKPVRTYERKNGLHIDGNGDNQRDRLRLLPSKNEIISISTSVSPTDMEYFRFDENANFLEHKDDRYHGDHPLNARIFRVSPNGLFVITASSGAVYKADNTMEYLGQIQHGSLSFSDFAFSNDGNTIYAATSNLESIQIASYPDLTRSGQILTRGFPVFIFKVNDQIVSISKSYENSRNVGIELININ